MGTLTRAWNSYTNFADAGGPFRWVWTILIGFTATLLIIAWASQFARFAGRALAKGFREGMATGRAKPITPPAAGSGISPGPDGKRR